MPFPTKRVRRVEAPAPGRTRRFLLFEAGGFRCGLDVRILREVTEDPGIPPAEGGARPLLGSLPVQGGTLPTVDLAALFEGSGTGRRVLVVEAEGRRLGLLPGTVRAVAWQEERPAFLLDGKSLGPLLRTAAEDA